VQCSQRNFESNLKNLKIQKHLMKQTHSSKKIQKHFLKVTYFQDSSIINDKNSVLPFSSPAVWVFLFGSVISLAKVIYKEEEEEEEKKKKRRKREKRKKKEKEKEEK